MSNPLFCPICGDSNMAGDAVTERRDGMNVCTETVVSCRKGHYQSRVYRDHDKVSERIGPFWFHYYEDDDTARGLIKAAIKLEKQKYETRN